MLVGDLVPVREDEKVLETDGQGFLPLDLPFTRSEENTFCVVYILL